MICFVQRNDELYHHGIKGQQWGVRRFQNKDGTRTSAGKTRYSSLGNNIPLGYIPKNVWNKIDKMTKLAASKRFWNAYKKYSEKYGIKLSNETARSRNQRTNRAKLNYVTESLLYGPILDEHNRLVKDNFVKYLKDTEKNKVPMAQNKIVENAKYIAEAYGKDMAQLYSMTIKEMNHEYYNRSDQIPQGIPASAISEKQKAEYESKMKQNIPSSAWNQRVDELNRKKIETNTEKIPTGIPSSALEAKQKAEYESRMKEHIPASAWDERTKTK